MERTKSRELKGEWARISRHQTERSSVGTKTEERFAGTDFKEEVRQHLLVCIDFEEEVRPHLLLSVQYRFGIVFEVNIRHKFQGRYSTFLEAASIKFLERILRSTTAFITNRTVRILGLFGTNPEDSSLLFMHRNRGQQSSDFQARFLRLKLHRNQGSSCTKIEAAC